MKLFSTAICVVAFVFNARAGSLKISGSRVFAPAVVDAAKILREENGIEITLATDGGTSGGVAALAQHEVEIAVCIRPVSADERAQVPDFTFNEIHVGEFAVALAVSPDVWRGGIRVLSRSQVRDIYESRVTNWKNLGGPDAKIAFYNRDEGHGAWEMFAGWVYDELRKAPGSNLDTVANDEEALEALATKPGAISQVALLLADGKSSFPLSLKNDDGKRIAPSLENIALKKYPMTSPLLLVVSNRPTGDAKLFVDFMLGPRGQEILKKYGLVPIADLEKAKEP
jgi:phosphate transport system substrate-binding protein